MPSKSSAIVNQMPGCSPSTPHTMWKHWKNCGYKSSTLYLGSREGLGICAVPSEVKGAMSPYVTLFVTFIFLLFKTISRHWNCFLSSVVKNGKGEHGVQPVKVGLLMLCLHKSPKNIMVWHPLHNPTGAFCEWVKTLSNDFSTELTKHSPKTAISPWHSSLYQPDPHVLHFC